jgi:AGCS family alanine or glycine:cation symporter
VRRVAKVAEVVLPLMALAYVLLALVIIGMNISNLPHAFAEIIGGAFGVEQMAGGFTGGVAAAMLNGVRAGSVLQRGRHGQRTQCRRQPPRCHTPSSRV